MTPEHGRRTGSAALPSIRHKERTNIRKLTTGGLTAALMMLVFASLASADTSLKLRIHGRHKSRAAESAVMQQGGFDVAPTWWSSWAQEWFDNLINEGPPVSMRRSGWLVPAQAGPASRSAAKTC